MLCGGGCDLVLAAPFPSRSGFGDTRAACPPLGARAGTAAAGVDSAVFISEAAAAIPEHRTTLSQVICIRESKEVPRV